MASKAIKAPDRYISGNSTQAPTPNRLTTSIACHGPDSV
jgi:hypothetical protein